MRVKIEGEITPDRIARAVERALELLASADPDAKFYGANLYLNSYDVDGESFDVVDDDHNPIGLRIPAPAGTIVKPVLTAQARQRRRAAREEQQQRELEAAELRRQEDAELRQRRKNQAVQDAKAKETFDSLNVLTSQLLASEPDKLIDGLNEAIRSSWQALDPKEPHGPRKGAVKPLPSFSTVDGKLVLSTPAWKTKRLVLNPVGHPREGAIVPVWTFAAWIAAINGFLRLMEDLSGPLPPAITSGLLRSGN